MENNKDELERTILKKIEEMEDPAYTFPERFPRGDYGLIGVCLIVFLILLVAGVHL